MAITTGFNHVAVTTADLDRMKRFYADAFDGVATLATAGAADHPRMAVIDPRAGAALTAPAGPAASIVGARRSQGGRGPIDHYGLAVDSLATLQGVRGRLVAAGAEIGDIQRLGEEWSLFFRDPDGME